jgi:poly-gamma-glutamate synthesis protein (capsule biosynthesis protein)
MIDLAFVGDVGLCGRAAERLRAQIAATPDAAFLRPLREADITFANLETPFCGEPEAFPGVRTLARPDDAHLLKELSLDVVSLANNHVFDAGDEGLALTRRLLAESGIQGVGAGSDLPDALRLLQLEKKGIRLGFLAFAEGRARTHKYVAGSGRAGAAPLDARLMRRAISEARPKVDLLCVSLHQGLNYVPYASPRQRQFARLAAEAGADLVIGHHPHVLQGHERYGDAISFYSLGEFVWDSGIGDVVEPRWEQARRKTAVLVVRFAPGEPLEFQLHPFRRNEEERILPLPDGEREEFQSWFAEVSSIYDDYDPQAYLEAASAGVAQHTLKVLFFHLKKGDLRYLARSLARVRWRHVRLAWAFVRRRGKKDRPER